MEYELTEIYHRLCNDGESDFHIMNALCLQERNYYKYKKRLDARLMEYQRKKTINTIFMESQLLKNRMLTLYRVLEDQVISDKTSGTDKAKCAEVAANIAIDVLKMESEGIKAGKELLGAEKAAETATKIPKTTNSSTINNNNMVLPSRDMMMEDDDLEESC